MDENALLTENTQQFFLGKDIVLKVTTSPIAKSAIAIRHGTIVKTVNLRDKVEKKLFIIDLVELGAKKSHLADALKISRQSIHNYIEIKKHFGSEGLIHGYTMPDGKDIRKQRKAHEKNRPSGSKSVQVAELRKKAKEAQTEEEIKSESPHQLTLNFSFDEEKLAPGDQPFSENHDWESCRYAGLFTYWAVLIDQWGWLQLIIKYFGAKWRIFSVFMFMAALNIRSIEQLKNTRFREAGIALGIMRLPGKAKVWEWFYSAANMKRATFILKDYFQRQVQSGLVGLALWFSDGHLLPYTGKETVHYSYSTQRQRPVPGRTNQVVCDAHGRIVDFKIEEGKGKMKDAILEILEKWSSYLPVRPMIVFDREGYDACFFSCLINAKQSFVTWDKNVNSKKLSEMGDALFSCEFIFNNKDYAIFEEIKSFSYKDKEVSAEGEAHEFELRQIHIWNKTTGRRTSCLAYAESCDMSSEECVKAILSRWGASENTFKHIAARHPFHYHPGFTLVDSEKQDIANPEIKEKETSIKQLKKFLSKLYKKFSNIDQTTRKDGKPRVNSAYDRTKEVIQQEEEALNKLQDENNALPERVDVSSLEDYESFKQIDNEGKNLFDFVTTSVWNARKQMSDWLGEYYNQENEVIDLFYTITHCHGWVRSTNEAVTVRMEPLQQGSRRLAQEQLCRKLTSLGAQFPNGKRLVIEVGESPVK